MAFLEAGASFRVKTEVDKEPVALLAVAGAPACRSGWPTTWGGVGDGLGLRGTGRGLLPPGLRGLAVAALAIALYLSRPYGVRPCARRPLPGERLHRRGSEMGKSAFACVGPDAPAGVPRVAPFVKFLEDRGSGSRALLGKSL